MYKSQSVSLPWVRRSLTPPNQSPAAPSPRFAWLSATHLVDHPVQFVVGPPTDMELERVRQDALRSVILPEFGWRRDEVGQIEHPAVHPTNLLVLGNVPDDHLRPVLEHHRSGRDDLDLARLR